jgi:hypothetical protein
MLDELIEYLASPDLDEDAFVRLDGLALQAEGARLRLSILDGGEPSTLSRWEVKAEGLVEYGVAEAQGNLTLTPTGHVLARQHTEPRWSLHFTGNAASPHELMGRLLSAHTRLARNWIPFARYLNAELASDQLLGEGFGTFADGPQFLIEAYDDVLHGAGLQTSRLGPRPNRYWTGSQWNACPEDLAVLMVGQAFFVAQDFEEKRVE